jgi:plasmid stability protein
MPASKAHNACMQYTVRQVPAELDRALRRRARREGKSLNEVTVEALREAVGLAEVRVKRRSLADLVGTWQEDPEFDAAVADQRRIDADLWK